jgi:hypothetical protein
MTSRLKVAAEITAGGLLVLGANAAVLAHARSLYNAAPVEQSIHTPMGPAESLTGFSHLWQNIEPAFNKWFLEMYVGWPALPLFVFALYLGWRRFLRWYNAGGRRSLADWNPFRNFGDYRHLRTLFWGAWVLSFAVFSIQFVARYGDHDYYLCSLLPLAAITTSLGAETLLRTKMRGLLSARLTAYVLLAGSLVFMYTRVRNRWLKPQVPLELVDQSARLVSAIPPGERVLVYGDPSPIVFLYYLRHKGLVVSRAMPRESVESLVTENGFRYAVVYRDQAPSWIDQIFSRNIARVGEFAVLAVPGLNQPSE